MDPQSVELVPSWSYKSILEEIVRGKMLKEKNEGTKFFATSLERKWKKMGCINENKELVIDKLREAMKQDLIDASIFSNAIGK